MIYTKFERHNNGFRKIPSIPENCFNSNVENNSFIISFFKNDNKCGSEFITDYLNYDINIYIPDFPVKRQNFDCFPSDKFLLRRLEFCRSFFSFPEFCTCGSQYPIIPSGKEVSSKIRHELSKIPIIVLSSNEPEIFMDFIKSLMKVDGLVIKNIEIHIDEKNPEILGIIELFGLKYIENPASCRGDCRQISQIRASFLQIFQRFNFEEFIIVLKDDTLVSNDILKYFSNLLKIYRNETSIHHISAGNDHVFLN